MSLTNKRKLFVEEYLKDFNATGAAERAGYKNPNKLGPRLVKVGAIAEAIKQHLSDKAMSAEECLSRLAEFARGDEPNTVTIKALELIGKTHSLFVDRQQVELEHSLSDKLSGQIDNALARGYGDEPD